MKFLFFKNIKKKKAQAAARTLQRQNCELSLKTLACSSAWLSWPASTSFHWASAPKPGPGSKHRVCSVACCLHEMGCLACCPHEMGCLLQHPAPLLPNSLPPMRCQHVRDSRASAQRRQATGSRLCERPSRAQSFLCCSSAPELRSRRC